MTGSISIQEFLDGASGNLRRAVGDLIRRHKISTAEDLRDLATQGLRQHRGFGSRVMKETLDRLHEMGLGIEPHPEDKVGLELLAARPTRAMMLEHNCKGPEEITVAGGITRLHDGGLRIILGPFFSIPDFDILCGTMKGRSGRATLMSPKKGALVLSISLDS